MDVLLITHGGADEKTIDAISSIAALCAREGYGFSRVQGIVDDARALNGEIERADAVLFAASDGHWARTLLRALTALKKDPGLSYPAAGLIYCANEPERAPHGLDQVFLDFTWHFGCDTLGVLPDAKGVETALELIGPPRGYDAFF